MRILIDTNVLISAFVFGGRDFLEADLERPQILSPAMLHDFLTSGAR